MPVIQKAHILVDISTAPDLDPDPQVYHDFYNLLKKLDLGEALGQDPRDCLVGLDAAARLIEQMLTQPGAEISPAPDLVFIESSLFADQVNMGDKFRDFVSVKIRTGISAQQDVEFKRVARTYGTLYPQLHDKQYTIYYNPRFFLEALTMTTYMSHHPGEAEETLAATSGTYEERLEEVRRDLKDARDPGLLWRENDDQPDGVRTWYCFRNLEKPEQGVWRKEKTRTQEQELIEDVRLFHTLFHENALEGYECSYLWCVPLVGGVVRRDDEYLTGMGAVFAVAAYRKQPPPLTAWHGRKVGQSLAYLMKDALTPYLYKAAQTALGEVRRLAVRAAIGAIMGRNMSHNIGSHALARLNDDIIKEAPRGIERMLQYLQERMDFVARVATDWPSWREPSLFFGDLLKGFLGQGVLLDNLIADDGYRAENVVFCVRAPESTTLARFVYHRGDDGASQYGVPSEYRYAGGGEGPPDFLVAVPGGPVGRQAFYGFLENALRNAAKHNPNRGTLQVVIDFSDHEEGRAMDEGSYCVHFQDSISILDGRDSVCPRVQDHLRNVLVDANGSLVTEGWGIQEMKVYAEYLAYRPGSEGRPGGDPILSVSGRELLVAPGGAEVLTYKFTLQRPCLALVINADVPAGNEALGLRYGLKIVGEEVDFRDPRLSKAIHDASPGLLYITTDVNDVDMVTWLSRQRLSLPARVLLRPRSREQTEPLRHRLAQAGLAQRVRVDDDEPGLEAVFAANMGEAAVKAAVIDLYRRWLVATVTERGFALPLNTVVYFDRDSSSHAQRWAVLGESVKRYGLEDVLKVFPIQKKGVAGDEGGDSAATLREPWTVVERPPHGSLEVDPTAAAGTWLLFDNHNRGRPAGVLPEFYQYIGSFSSEGTRGPLPNNREVFERIANVPAEYSGVHFLLQLVESALLKVLIIDERVVGTVLRLVPGEEQLALSWQVTGAGEDEEEYGDKVAGYLGAAGVALVPFYNFNAGDRLHRFCLLRGESEPTWHVEGSQAPGLTIEGSRVTACAVLTTRNDVLDLYPVQLAAGGKGPAFDIVVIHRGLLERIAESAREIGVDSYSEMEFLESLHRLGARVVVTSGRGPQRQGYLAEYPFIEFAAVQGFVVRELSKPSLGSVLMALTGEERGDDW